MHLVSEVCKKTLCNFNLYLKFLTKINKSILWSKLTFLAFSLISFSFLSLFRRFKIWVKISLHLELYSFNMQLMATMIISVQQFRSYIHWVCLEKNQHASIYMKYVLSTPSHKESSAKLWNWVVDFLTRVSTSNQNFTDGFLLEIIFFPRQCSTPTMICLI